MSSDQHDDPCVLASFRTEVEAALTSAALAALGIDVRAVGGNLAQFRGTDVPVDVQLVVRKTDLARARAILDTLPDDAVTIDWSQVDVGESDDAALNDDAHGSD